jgi:hypothetical protein
MEQGSETEPVGPAEDSMRMVGKALVVAGKAKLAVAREGLGRMAETGEGVWKKAGLLAADVRRMEGLLDAGYRPDEKPSETQASVDELLARWHGEALFKQERVQTALQPLLAPLGCLATSDAASLRQTALSEATRLGIRLAAWHKLGAPATRKELVGSLRAGESLMGAVGKLEDQERGKRLAGEIELASRGRWAGFLDRARGNDDVEFALSLRGKGVDEDAPELSPRSRYNMALHDLRQGADKSPADMKALGARLAEAAAKLPESERLSPAVSDLLAALAESSRAPELADFRAAGPLTPNMPSADLIAWQVKYDAKADRVTYTAHVSEDITRDELELVFGRVRGTSGSAPVYLCTTELPVGLFIDAVTALDKWREVSPLLWNYDPRKPDPRLGPRTWEWSRYRQPSQGVRRTIVWLDGQIDDHYPPQLATADNSTVLKDADGHPARLLNPSKRQPLQYVSPRAAIYFANLLGCRLQTPAEWKAAYAQNGCNHPNLRDRTWKLQARWAAGSQATLAYYPDGGIFLPPHRGSTSAVWNEAALGIGRAGREYDDGCLWFVETYTQTPDVFNHLVGNVAELAMEGNRCFVIGGSAMSPPDLPVDKAIEVPDWQESKGYSDVGARLAFSLPMDDAERVKGTIRSAPYLLK